MTDDIFLTLSLLLMGALMARFIDPDRRCAPVAEWPRADREAWALALADPDPLDPAVGFARRWRPSTRGEVQRGYGRFLGWAARSGKDAYFGDTYVTTTRKGATLVRTGARVKRVGLVASTCPTCGKVAVLLDGKRIGTVDLAGPRRATTVLMLPAVSLQRATVTLRVRSSGQRVRIDGLVLSRS